MKFEMWSLMHLLYIISPFIIFLILYLSVKKSSDKAKYIVGVVIGALYGIVVYKSEFNKKDLFHSLIFVSICLITVLICNNTFRLWFGWEPNYFYLYNYNGTPLKFLYNATPTSVYEWFHTKNQKNIIKRRYLSVFFLYCY